MKFLVGLLGWKVGGLAGAMASLLLVRPFIETSAEGG